MLRLFYRQAICAFGGFGTKERDDVILEECSFKECKLLQNKWTWLFFRVSLVDWLENECNGAKCKKLWNEFTQLEM